MRRKYSPADADRLILDTKRIRHACDYLRNPAFTKARATTVDYLGRRLVDTVNGESSIHGAAQNLERDVRRLLHGETVTLDPLREGRVPKPDGRTRTIYVPTYRARCFLNLVGDVLVATSNHLLLPHTRAYRPGLRQAVPNAVMDLAASVTEGARCWAKLDITNFFHEISHKMISAALARYGYSETFIHVVLSMTKSPVWKELGVEEFAIDEKGVPMGLAPAVAIANLVCHEIDAALHAQRGHVTPIRYADDFLLVAEHHDRLVHAVRLVQRWTRAHGLRLKGVSPDQRPRTLVHDFRAEPLPALGFEIDGAGGIHIPASKLAAKDDEIDYLMGRLHENGEIVVGRSSYRHPSGVREVGTDMMDASDIKAVVEGAYRDWQHCDPEGASGFLHRAWVRHPELLHCGSSTIWIASLGDLGVGRHEGLRCLPSAIAEPIPPTPPPGALRARGAAGGGTVETRERIRQALTGGPDLGTNSTSSDRATAPSVDGIAITNDHSITINGDSTLGIENEGTGDLPYTDTNRSTVGMVGSDGIPGHGSMGDVATNPGRDADPDRGLSWLRWRLSSVDTSIDNWFDSLVSQVVPYLASASTDTDRVKPSHSRCFVNFRINAHHVARHEGVPGSRVAVTLGADAVEEFYPHVQTEVALVRELRKRMLVEINQGKRVLLVETDRWLPKHLLQRDRHFHSVVLFSEVLTLHRDVQRAGIWLLIAARSES